METKFKSKKQIYEYIKDSTKNNPIKSSGKIITEFKNKRNSFTISIYDKNHNREFTVSSEEYEVNNDLSFIEIYVWKIPTTQIEKENTLTLLNTTFDFLKLMETFQKTSFYFIFKTNTPATFTVPDWKSILCECASLQGLKYLTNWEKNFVKGSGDGAYPLIAGMFAFENSFICKFLFNRNVKNEIKKLLDEVPELILSDAFKQWNSPVHIWNVVRYLGEAYVIKVNHNLRYSLLNKETNELMCMDSIDEVVAFFHQLSEEKRLKNLMNPNHDNFNSLIRKLTVPFNVFEDELFEKFSLLCDDYLHAEKLASLWLKETKNGLVAYELINLGFYAVYRFFSNDNYWFFIIKNQELIFLKKPEPDFPKESETDILDIVHRQIRAAKEK